MNPMARLRHVLARRPWLYWLAVLAVAAGAGLAVADAVAAVGDARRAWGVERTVLIATRDAAPGEPLDGVVEGQPRPVPMIPDAALTEAPAGAVLRQHVSAGEIAVEADVTPTAAPQALIPPGWQGVAVSERVPTGAAVGDRVAVASGGVVLAGDAVVVAARGEAVLVAVPAPEAAAVAAAVSAADVALLLHP